MDFDITPSLAMGLRGELSFSSQPEDRLVAAMEGVFFQRFYVFDCVAKMWRLRPYFQTGLGYIQGQEVEYKVGDIVGEASIGCRAHFVEGLFKSWYGDLNVRYGYPFQIGVSLLVGHSFLP
jgi:hypothetical protein